MCVGVDTLSELTDTGKLKYLSIGELAGVGWGMIEVGDRCV